MPARFRAVDMREEERAAKCATITRVDLLLRLADD